MLNLNKLTHLIERALLTGALLLLVACGDGMNEQQMLAKAKGYMSGGDLRAASIELRNTLKKNNANAEALYLLGSLDLKFGNFAGAEKEFEDAEQAGWDQQETQIALARTLLISNKSQKLLDIIKIKNDWSADTNANVSALRALAEASLGDIEKAKITLSKGQTYKKDALYMLIATARFQFAQQLDGHVKDTLATALSLYPNNADLLLLQAKNDIQNNKFTAAEDTLTTIIKQYPSQIITVNGRRARINLARLHITNGDIDKAAMQLTPLLKRNSKDPEVNYLSGLITFSQKDYHAAEEHLRTVLAITPGHNLSQQLMGKIKFSLNDYEQAALHLSEYLKTRPNDSATRKLLAQTYIILNQPEQAQEVLQVNQIDDSNDPATLILLSQIELNKGNITASIKTLQHAIKANSENLELHKQLAKAYIANHNTQQALDEIKRIKTLGGDTTETQKLSIAAYIGANKINKAISTAQQMLKANKDDPDILVINGILYDKAKNTFQARTYFNQALQLQKHHPKATVGLARIESNAGNLDIAIALYTDLVKSKVGGTTPMLALATLAAKQNRTNDMLSWLEKARTTAPKEIKARILLANYYLKNSKVKQADTYIQEALKIAPEQAVILLLHSKILITQNRYNEAISPLKKIIIKSPDSIDAHVLLGKAFLYQNMPAKARKHLLTALRQNENHILARILMVEVELKEGHYEKSLRYTKNIQKTHPNLDVGYMLEGDIWMIKKNHQQARTAYSKAWEHKQTSELATKLFSVLRITSTFDDAIKPLTSWLSKNSDDTSMRLFLAVSYQNVSRNIDAIKEYETILKQDPNNITALNNLAWLYSLSGDSRALTLAEKAYRAAPNHAGILDTYGWILVQQKQAEKGARLIKQALDRAPDILEIQYHYAVALLNSGDSNQGKKILTQLLKQKKPFDGREEAQRLLSK